MDNQLSFKHAGIVPFAFLVVLGGLLAGAAELPYGGWAQIPILSLIWWQLHQQKSAPLKRYLSLGLTFGTAYFVVALWWLYISLHDVGGMNFFLSCMAVFLLSAYLALYFAAATLSIRTFQHPHLSGLFLAAGWVIAEYLRGLRASHRPHGSGGPERARPSRPPAGRGVRSERGGRFSGWPRNPRTGAHEGTRRAGSATSSGPR